MTFNTYDVWWLDDGVLTGCSSWNLSRFPTDGPVRLPLNHPNDTMFLSGSKLCEPSSVTSPPPVKLHSTCRSSPAIAVGGWLTSRPRRLECSVSCFESKRSPVSEQAPPDCQPPTEIFTGLQGKWSPPVKHVVFEPTKPFVSPPCSVPRPEWSVEPGANVPSLLALSTNAGPVLSPTPVMSVMM